MKPSRLLLFIVALTTGTVVVSADPPVVVLDWLGGECPPGAGWTIDPNNPSCRDVIYFTGYTNTVTNLLCAETTFGDASLVVDDVNRVVELKFDGDPCAPCYMYWDPVYGYLEGRFGPLADGDWRFYCNHPGSTFSIPFTVSSWLEVRAPDGGEVLLAGSTYTIRWEDFRGTGCPGNYLLEYSTDHGQNWVPVDTSPISCTCSYDWLVPSIDSNQCLIRVVDIGDPNIRDAGDAPFTIYQCTLTTDLNNDCCIDLRDLEILAEHWLHNANPVVYSSIIQGGIEYYLQTNKSVYVLGENIEILYRVTNLSLRPVSFSFPNTQQCHFEVRSFSTVIWTWPLFTLPMLTSFTLSPGEFKEYSIEWDMTNNSTPSPLGPGYYDVTGVLLYPFDPRQYVPVSVQIHITTVPVCAGPAPLGDLDGSCLIDFLDFAVLTSDWLRCGNPFEPHCAP